MGGIVPTLPRRCRRYRRYLVAASCPLCRSTVRRGMIDLLLGIL